MMTTAKTSDRRNQKDYINNQKLFDCLVDYKQRLQVAIDNNDPIPEMPNYIGQSIALIANNLAKHWKFVRYTRTWKEEMILDGIENCIMYGVRSFDPLKTQNPFSYFTQIIYFAFIRRITKEKMQQYIKCKVLQNHQLTELLVDNTVIYDQDQVVDKIIEDFEQSVRNKKSKQQASLKKGSLNFFMDIEVNDEQSVKENDSSTDI